MTKPTSWFQAVGLQHMFCVKHDDIASDTSAMVFDNRQTVSISKFIRDAADATEIIKNSKLS